MMTGYEGNLTAQQKDVLDKVKARLAASEFAKDVAQNPDGDTFLLRFLRASMKDRAGAREFDLDAGLARLQATLAFRREVKADEVRARVEAGDFPAEYLEYRDQVRPRYGFMDKTTGRYVCFERFGLLAANAKVQAFTEEQWASFVVWDMEERHHFVRQESKRRGYGVTQQILVFDLRGGAGLMNIMSGRIGLFKGLSRIAGQHYPEFINRVWLLSAPFLVTKIIDFLKTFMDPVTVSKLRAFSDVPGPLLVEAFGEADVPEEYGGKNPVVVPRTSHAGAA